MDVTVLLEGLLRLETAMRDLYGWLAQVFVDRSEVSTLFSRLRLQEDTHANLVRYQRRLVVQNPGRIREVEANIGDVHHALSRIKAFRSATDFPTLADAVALAVELEGSTAERIHRSLAAGSDPELAQLVTALAGDDARHLQLLEKLREQLPGPARIA